MTFAKALESRRWLKGETQLVRRGFGRDYRKRAGSTETTKAASLLRNVGQVASRQRDRKDARHVCNRLRECFEAAAAARAAACSAVAMKRAF